MELQLLGKHDALRAARRRRRYATKRPVESLPPSCRRAVVWRGSAAVSGLAKTNSMLTLNRLRSLWRNVVHRRRVEHDLDAEVRATFDMLVDDHVSRGMAPADARRAATLALGRT